MVFADPVETTVFGNVLVQAMVRLKVETARVGDSSSFSYSYSSSKVPRFFEDEDEDDFLRCLHFESNPE